jgi:hypothetical protein
MIPIIRYELLTSLIALTQKKNLPAILTISVAGEDYKLIENKFQFQIAGGTIDLSKGERGAFHCCVTGTIDRSARTSPIWVVAVTRRGNRLRSSLTHRRRAYLSATGSSVVSDS